MKEKPSFTRKNLTKILATTKPSDGDISFKDYRCLKVRVNKGGDLSVFCKGKPRGSRKQVTVALGRFTKETKDIQPFLDEWLTAMNGLRRSLDPNKAKQCEMDEAEKGRLEERARQITIREALKLYERDKGNDASTNKERRNIFNRRIADWLDKPVRDLQPAMVKERYQKICYEVKLANGKTGSVSEANNLHRYLNAVCNWLMKEEVTSNSRNYTSQTYLDDNPCRTIRPRKLKRRQTSILECLPEFFRALNYENLQRAHNADIDPRHPMLGFYGANLRDYLLLTIFTGLRKEEVLHIETQHIDPKRELFKIPDTKNDEPHALAFSSKTKPLLIERMGLAEDGYIFKGRSKDQPYRDVDGRLKILSERIGHKFTSHDLRRTFATIAFGETGDIKTVGQMLNHTVSSVTESYIVGFEAVAEANRKRMQQTESQIMKQAYEGKDPKFVEIDQYSAEYHGNEPDSDGYPTRFERSVMRESIDQLGFIKTEEVGRVSCSEKEYLANI